MPTYPSKAPFRPRLAPLTESARARQVTVAGQELSIFIESPALFQAMLTDIQGARQRVWVESYIFLDDAAGQVLAQALKERARAGVDVRVHYDAIGSSTTPAAFFEDLAAAGVQVHAFHSFWEALWSFRIFRILNRRNHRKLMVIDDLVAYFGGMNLVDQSGVNSVAAAERLPASAGWRDVHVRLRGSQQHEVAESFERGWRRAHRLPVKRRPRAYRQALLAGGEQSIQFFDCGPGLRHTRATRVFRGILANARRSVRLSMAYFLPFGGVLRELVRAHRRGVFLQVVVPGHSDVPIVQHASRWLYGKLLRRRFHLYERQLNMLHSKVLVADDSWTVVGSCNLDARSLWINLEFLAVIHSPAFARTMRAIIQNEIGQSRRVTVREYAQRSWRQRLLERLAWSFRWWL